MPGKVNPVLPEATLMVCARVVGNDATIAWAGAAGSFELNVMMPVMAHALLESVHVLSTSTVLLAERCVDGITADAERMRRYAESSPSVVTPLNAHIGYEEAAKVAKKALAEGATIRETVIAMGYVERGDLTEERARRRPRRRLDDGAMMDATREAFRAIDRAMTGDSRVLEVGCGSGEMAERIAALAGVALVATDYSEDCVELTAARGVDARHADICYLPFDPGASTWSTPDGCSTTSATPSGPSPRSAACCARAARSSPSPAARWTPPPRVGTASPARPGSGCCRAGSATCDARTSRPSPAT